MELGDALEVDKRTCFGVRHNQPVLRHLVSASFRKNCTVPLLINDRIRSLVANGKIATLTVDTNIFDAKRLRLNSTTLLALKGLAVRGFRFVLAGTVAKEVELHIEKAAEDAFRNANKEVGTALGAFDTADPSRQELMNQITRGLNPEQVARERLEQYVIDTSCEVLKDTERVEIGDLFARYFTGRPPFGDGRKKDEFPDALALLALEEFARVEQAGMLVVSEDKDWQKFCAESDWLYLVPEIENALALVANAPPALRRAVFDWMAKEEHKQELFNHFERLAEEIDFVVHAYPSMGECETYTWGNELKFIHLPLEEEIDIIDLELDEGNNVVGMILSFQLGLSLSVPVEISFSIWDSVDRDSIPMGSKSLEIEREEDFPATVEFKVCNLGSEDEDWDIVDVEIGPKYVEIDLGEIDVFEPEDYSDMVEDLDVE